MNFAASLALIVVGSILSLFAGAIHRFNVHATRNNPFRRLYWPPLESPFYIVLGRLVGVSFVALGFWLLVTRV